ncbi:MAG: hypothetical protein IJS56_01690 [Bacilli bacterium]|nr:hypothetical protein [Bacilli bacterium]
MRSDIREKNPLHEFLKTVSVAFVLVIIVFCVAFITKLKENENNSSDDVITSSTTSLIDSIIPITKSSKSSIEEIEKVFESSGDALVEEQSNKYTFNKYMKNFSYSHLENTKIYSYDLLEIIYYDDLSGIVKLFIFNKQNLNHIKTIKTIQPISDKYELSFKIIDSNLYYLDASTSRDDNNCLIMKSAKMKYFNLLDYEIEDYKEYEFSEEVNLTC